MWMVSRLLERDFRLSGIGPFDAFYHLERPWLNPGAGNPNVLPIKWLLVVQMAATRCPRES
jgi:hypothetical protein